MDKKTISDLEIVAAAYHNHHQAVQRYKNEGWPIFGYLTEHVPLELLYAADILPIRIQGGKDSALASEHLQNFACSYCRTAVHEAMTGEYDYLDGLLSSKTCDVALHLFQVWSFCRALKFTWLLSLPGNNDEEAIAYFREELFTLKEALESFRGEKISDQKLKKATLLYNEIRNIVGQLWQKKYEGSLSLTAGEIICALKGCQVLPPDVSLDRLKGLIEYHSGRTEGSLNNSVSIILLGNTFVDVSVIEMIEMSGGRVIIDDTVSTGRHFGEPVMLEGDPLTSLAQSYTAKVTGAYRLTYEDRRDHILQIIRKWNVQASIHILQKYCDTSFFELPLILQDLEDQGIPSLVIEVDDTSPALGQMETRVQAFLEMVGGI